MQSRALDKRQDRAKRTRDQLLEAAELVFASKGYHETAMHDIVTKSGRSKGAIYFHFPSKQSVFEAVLDALAYKLERKVNNSIDLAPTALAKLDAALTTLVDTFATRHRMARLGLIEIGAAGPNFQPQIQRVRNRFTLLIRKQLDYAVSENLINEMDTDLASRIWFGAINQFLIDWIQSGSRREKLDTDLPALRISLLKSVGIDSHLV
tara:strand:- start:6034 stop:6657 length:624 start_codon:yes stop_codon:yes gene_type:complete